MKKIAVWTGVVAALAILIATISLSRSFTPAICQNAATNSSAIPSSSLSPDLHNPTASRKLETNPVVTDIQFDQDENLILGDTGGDIKSIKLLSSDNIADVTKIAVHSKSSLTLSPNGLIAASIGDGIVKLWNSKSGENVQTIIAGDDVGALALNDDASLLALATATSIQIWNVTDKTRLHTLTSRNLVSSMTFSKDSSTLAYGTAGDNDSIGDVFVVLIDVKSGREFQALKGHNWSVGAIAFSPNNEFLASGSVDKQILLWNPCSGSHATLKGQTSAVTTLTFNPTTSLLASGGVDNSIHLWNPKTYQLVDTLKEHQQPISALVFAPKSSMLASTSTDGTLVLWTLNNQ